MKTRIYAAPAVKGLRVSWLNRSASLSRPPLQRQPDIPQWMLTIHSAVANYLRLLTHRSLNILIISQTCGWSYDKMHMALLFGR